MPLSLSLRCAKIIFAPAEIFQLGAVQTRNNEIPLQVTCFDHAATVRSTVPNCPARDEEEIIAIPDFARTFIRPRVYNATTAAKVSSLRDVSNKFSHRKFLRGFSLGGSFRRMPKHREMAVSIKGTQSPGRSISLISSPRGRWKLNLHKG